GGVLVLPGLGEVQVAVLVGVADVVDAVGAQHWRRVEVVPRARGGVVVGDHHVVQRHVARVGHRVGERQRAAGRHVHAGGGVGVVAVDELDDLDGRRVHEVVGRVAAGDLLAGEHVGAGDDGGVLVLAADQRGVVGGVLVHPGLGEVQVAVLVGVADVVDAVGAQHRGR